MYLLLNVAETLNTFVKLFFYEEISAILLNFLATKYACFSSLVVVAELIDMNKPDERAVMTYVSCYYHAFSGAQKVSNFIYSSLNS